jgi:hypothetical protein
MLSSLPLRISLALAGWRERRALASELATLRMQGELERTLADSGVSPSEVLRLFRQHPGAGRQFREMSDRIGVDRARLPLTQATGAALRDMEWRCGECRAWRDCRAWLASGLWSDGYIRFCPNAAALEQMRDEQRAQPAETAPEPYPPPGILAELKAKAGQYF